VPGGRVKIQKPGEPPYFGHSKTQTTETLKSIPRVRIPLSPFHYDTQLVKPENGNKIDNSIAINEKGSTEAKEGFWTISRGFCSSGLDAAASTRLR
jgi:hypothetical protein